MKKKNHDFFYSFKDKSTSSHLIKGLFTKYTNRQQVLNDISILKHIFMNGLAGINRFKILKKKNTHKHDCYYLITIKMNHSIKLDLQTKHKNSLCQTK